MGATRIVNSAGAELGSAASPLVTSTAAAAATTVLNRASAAAVASGNSGSLAATNVATLAVDVDVTAITGGTAPTVQFHLDRLGVDGIWYTAWSGSVLSAAGKSSTSVGPGCATAAVLTSEVRLRWVFAGTVAPTSVTFSASIVGR